MSGLALAFAGTIPFSMKSIVVKLSYAAGVDVETLIAARCGISAAFLSRDRRLWTPARSSPSHKGAASAFPSGNRIGHFGVWAIELFRFSRLAIHFRTARTRHPVLISIDGDGARLRFFRSEADQVGAPRVHDKLSWTWNHVRLRCRIKPKLLGRNGFGAGCSADFRYIPALRQANHRKYRRFYVYGCHDVRRMYRGHRDVRRESENGGAPFNGSGNFTRCFARHWRDGPSLSFHEPGSGKNIEPGKCCNRRLRLNRYDHFCFNPPGRTADSGYCRRDASHHCRRSPVLRRRSAPRRFDVEENCADRLRKKALPRRCRVLAR